MKAEDVKKLTFLGIGAVLALASTFIFDLYKTSSSEQRILWARDYYKIESSGVCENDKTGITRLLLRNTSKRNATVKLVFEGKVTKFVTEPKHVIKFGDNASGVHEVTINDLISKENVRILACGASYKSPSIETVIASGKSQNSGSLSLELEEHSFNDPFGLLKFLAKIFGLIFLVVLIYQAGHFDGSKKNSKKEDST